MNERNISLPKSQRDSTIHEHRIEPIIYTISKIPWLPGTRSCSVGRTRNSNGGSSGGAGLSENEIPSGPLRASTRGWGIMNESPRRGKNGCREKRESDSSLSSLSRLNGTERKNPCGHFSIAQWGWLLASPLSLLLRLATRVSMLLRHNSDTYRRDSWLYLVETSNEEGGRGCERDEEEKEKEIRCGFTMNLLDDSHQGRGSIQVIYAISFWDEVTRPCPVNNAILREKNVDWFD